MFCLLIVILLSFMNNTCYACSSNCYDLLELRKDATQSEVKRNYHSLSLKYHSDKCTNNTEMCNKKFVQITTAYNILKNDRLRQAYDTNGMTGVNQVIKEIEKQDKEKQAYEEELLYKKTVKETSKLKKNQLLKFSSKELKDLTINLRIYEKNMIERMDYMDAILLWIKQYNNNKTFDELLKELPFSQFNRFLRFFNIIGFEKNIMIEDIISLLCSDNYKTTLRKKKMRDFNLLIDFYEINGKIYKEKDQLIDDIYDKMNLNCTTYNNN